MFFFVIVSKQIRLFDSESSFNSIMEYLLSIPLKKTYEVDLVKYLKVSITAQYGNVDEKSKDNLEVLNRMRNNATSRSIESSQETSLEIIEK